MQRHWTQPDAAASCGATVVLRLRWKWLAATAAGLLADGGVQAMCRNAQQTSDRCLKGPTPNFATALWTPRQSTLPNRTARTRSRRGALTRQRQHLCNTPTPTPTPHARPCKLQGAVAACHPWCSSWQAPGRARVICAMRTLAAAEAPCTALAADGGSGGGSGSCVLLLFRRAACTLCLPALKAGVALGKGRP